MRGGSPPGRGGFGRGGSLYNLVYNSLYKLYIMFFIQLN